MLVPDVCCDVCVFLCPHTYIPTCHPLHGPDSSLGEHRRNEQQPSGSVWERLTQ